MASRLVSLDDLLHYKLLEFIWLVCLTLSFVTDFLAMVGGIGCIVQSALTLLVFFPRSIAQENGFTLLAQPSVATNSQAPDRARGGDDDDDYRNFDYGDAMPATSPVAMAQLSSMPSPEEDREHRRKAQEWISRQQQNQNDLSPSANGTTRGFAFGTRARGGSISSATGSVTRVGAAMPRPVSGVSQFSGIDGDGTVDRDKAVGMEEGERETHNRDTFASFYSGTGTDATISPPTSAAPNSQLPPSYTPVSPMTPGTPGQRRPFATAPSLPTVIEPDNSRTTTPLPGVYSTLTPIPASASPLNQNQNAPSSRQATTRPAYFNTDSEVSPGTEHAAGSPFEYDYVDLESASIRAGRNGTLRPRVMENDKDQLSRSSSISKAALIPSSSRNPGAAGAPGGGRAGESNELAHVPFEEMRARGSRYSELAVRRAAERGEEIHPYVRIASLLTFLLFPPSVPQHLFSLLTADAFHS